ncbi:MAG: polysaccharide deacetylase family protein [Candidatus Gracilibacteria bacterium]|nr:polysaccharide deacetylase family protein [Candidatus Gracilibacteria bacterium]
MKKTSLLPLVVFCIFFLAYTIHFVVVVNNEMGKIESHSFVKTAQRIGNGTTVSPTTTSSSNREIVNKKENKEVVIEVKEIDQEEEKKMPVKSAEKMIRYVNYTWLNVRENPTLASPVIEKLNRNDEVEVIELTTASWAKIVSPQNTEGFVARRYLSSRPVEEKKVATIVPEVETITKQEPIVAPIDLYTVPIVSYHHISDKVGVYAKNLTLPDKNFIAQLDWLVGNDFETLDFRDLKAISEGKKAMTTKQVILTFDDGYDNAYIAAQYMNGKGLKGVFYIITDNIGKEGYLDWRQVKKMHDWGMEIGSHGVTSANLAYSSALYIDKELQESKEIIEAQIGSQVVSFAYPAGGYTLDAMIAAEKAGYSFARSIRSGSQYLKKEFFQLPTLRVFPPAGARQFGAWFGGR